MVGCGSVFTQADVETEPLCYGQFCTVSTDPSSLREKMECSVVGVATGTAIAACEVSGPSWAFPEGADECFLVKLDTAGATPQEWDDVSSTCTDGGAQLELSIEFRAAQTSAIQDGVNATCNAHLDFLEMCPEPPPSR
jgi:hypothetical protein